jgi:hypothetical protein
LAAYITTCFADWQSDTFRRGIMAVRNDKRTNTQIRRALRSDEVEGVHWYRKTDPDFEQFTYRKCHRGLRQVLEVGDTLFFRTLWRGKPYIIGYMVIAGKSGPANDPVCHADRSISHLIDFRLPVTMGLVRRLNPRARALRRCDFNHWVNARLGRNYLCLQRGRICGSRERYLIDLVLEQVHATESEKIEAASR